MLARETERIAATTDPIERAALREQIDWLSGDGHGGRRQPLAERNRADGQAGLDIEPHRRRMVKENLDEKFKAPEDPLRLVFVCAMWITGFDVPTCSTVYLDKPMKNHTLMQTIARANRVAPGKQAGLIVDYVGVFRNLKAALGDLRAAPPRRDHGPDRRQGGARRGACARRSKQAVEFAEARKVQPGGRARSDRLPATGGAATGGGESSLGPTTTSARICGWSARRGNCFARFCPIPRQMNFAAT